MYSLSSPGRAAFPCLAVCLSAFVSLHAQKPVPPASGGYLGAYVQEQPYYNPNLQTPAYVVGTCPTTYSNSAPPTPPGPQVAVPPQNSLAQTDPSGVSCATYVLEQQIGRKLALHTHYYGWTQIASDYNSPNNLWPDPQLQDDVNNGRIPVISWSCDESTTDEDEGSTDYAVAAGKQDVNITTTAKALQSLNVPIILRWFWEENDPSGGHVCRGDNGFSGTPPAKEVTDFINAFAHIRNIFTANAPNVAMAFGQATPANNPTGGLAFWPGAMNVDWISIDAYNKGNQPPFGDGYSCVGSYLNTDFSCDFDQAYNAYSGFQIPIFVGENGSVGVSDSHWNPTGAETQSGYLTSVSEYVNHQQGPNPSLMLTPYPWLYGYDYFDSTPVGQTTYPVVWTLDSNSQGTALAGGIGEFATLGETPFFNGGVTNFSLSVANPNQSGGKGQGLQFPVTVIAPSGFQGAVTMTDAISGSVSGWTSSFTPAMVTGAGTTTFNVTIGPYATPGSVHTITITGTSGTMTKTTTAIVTVSQ